jgi:hypothetical protein
MENRGLAARGFAAPRQQGAWLYDGLQQVYGSGQGIMDYNMSRGLKPSSRVNLPETTDAGRDDIDRFSLTWTTEIWEVPHNRALIDHLVRFETIKRTGPTLEILVRRWTGTIWQIDQDPRIAPTVPTLTEISRPYRFSLASGAFKMPTSIDWYAEDVIYNKIFQQILEQMQSSWLRMLDRSLRNEMYETMPTVIDFSRGGGLSQQELDELVINEFGMLNKNKENVWAVLLSTMAAQFRALCVRMNLEAPSDPMVAVIPSAPVIDESLIPTLMTARDRLFDFKVPIYMLDMKLRIGALRASRAIALSPAPQNQTTVINIGGNAAILQMYGDLLQDGNQTDPWNSKIVVPFYVRIPAGTTSVVIPSESRGNEEYSVDQILRGTGMWPPYDDVNPDPNLPSHRKIYYSCANPNELYHGNARANNSYQFANKHSKTSNTQFGVSFAGSPAVLDSPEAAAYIGRLANTLLELGFDTPAKFAEYVGRFDANLGTPTEMSDPHQSACAIFDIFGAFDRNHNVLQRTDYTYTFDNGRLDRFLTAVTGNAQQLENPPTLAANPDKYLCDYAIAPNGLYDAGHILALRHAVTLACATDRSNVAFRRAYTQSTEWLRAAFNSMRTANHRMCAAGRFLNTPFTDVNGNIDRVAANRLFGEMKTLGFWTSNVLANDAAVAAVLPAGGLAQNALNAVTGYAHRFGPVTNTFNGVLQDLFERSPEATAANGLLSLYEKVRRFRAIFDAAFLAAVGPLAPNAPNPAQADPYPHPAALPPALWAGGQNAATALNALQPAARPLVQQVTAFLREIAADVNTFSPGYFTNVNPITPDFAHNYDLVDLVFFDQFVRTERNAFVQATNVGNVANIAATRNAMHTALVINICQRWVTSAVVANRFDTTRGMIAQSFLDKWARMAKAAFNAAPLPNTISVVEQFAAVCAVPPVLTAIATTLDRMFVDDSYVDVLIKTRGIGMSKIIRDKLNAATAPFAAQHGNWPQNDPAWNLRQTFAATRNDIGPLAQFDLGNFMNTFVISARQESYADMDAQRRINDALANNHIGVLDTPIDCYTNQGFMRLLCEIYTDGHGQQHIDTVRGIIEAYATVGVGNIRYLTVENMGILLLGIGANGGGLGQAERADQLIGNLLKRNLAEIAIKDNIRLTKWSLAFLLGRLPPTPGVFRMMQATLPGIWFDATLVHLLVVQSKPAFYVPSLCLHAIVSEFTMREGLQEKFEDPESLYGMMRFVMANVKQLGIQVRHAYITLCQRLGAIVSPFEYFDGQKPERATGFVLVDDFSDDVHAVKSPAFNQSAPTTAVRISNVVDMRSVALGHEFFRNVDRKIEGFPTLTGMLPFQCVTFNSTVSGQRAVAGTLSSKWM